MVKLLSSRLAGQPITPFERGIVAFVIAIVAVSVPHAWMSNFQKEIHSAREAILREDCKVVRSAIDYYTVDKGNAPKSIDDVIHAGYLKALPAGFSLEACK